MVYDDYVNDDTGEVIEVERTDNSNPPPREIERNGKRFRRKFSSSSGGNIIVPFQFATTENKIRFDKRPSRKKQYF